jgi:hypothetical protein
VLVLEFSALVLVFAGAVAASAPLAGGEAGLTVTGGFGGKTSPPLVPQPPIAMDASRASNKWCRMSRPVNK